MWEHVTCDRVKVYMQRVWQMSWATYTHLSYQAAPMLTPATHVCNAANISLSNCAIAHSSITILPKAATLATCHGSHDVTDMSLTSDKWVKRKTHVNWHVKLQKPLEQQVLEVHLGALGPYDEHRGLYWGLPLDSQLCTQCTYSQ